MLIFTTWYKIGLSKRLSINMSAEELQPTPPPPPTAPNPHPLPRYSSLWRHCRLLTALLVLVPFPHPQLSVPSPMIFFLQNLFHQRNIISTVPHPARIPSNPSRPSIHLTLSIKYHGATSVTVSQTCYYYYLPCRSHFLSYSMWGQLHGEVLSFVVGRC